MLVFKKISLENDTEQFYSFLNSIEMKFMLPGQPDLPLFSEFCDWISSQICRFYHDLLLVFDGELLVGYVLAYDYRSCDRHCKVTGYVKDNKLMDVLEKFVSHLISEYPLNKLFIETTDEDLIKNALETGFAEEAVFKEYKYYASEYHDMHILGYTVREEK